MYTFVQVAELGSFAAVAEQEGVDRSVITRQIAALEKELGVQLIIRSTRQQALTTLGQQYLERCKAILDAVEQANSEVMDQQQRPCGRIKLSLPLSFGLRRLSPMLAQFASLYPDIELQLIYDDNFVDLVQQGFDVAIRVTHNPAQQSIVRKLGECHYVIVGSPVYLKNQGVPTRIQDLLHHHCLPYKQENRWVMQSNGANLTIPTSNRFRANNGEALAEAAAQGLGLSQLPDFIAKSYLQEGSLVEVLADYPKPTIGIFAVLPSNRYVPQRIRILIEYLKTQLPISIQP